MKKARLRAENGEILPLFARFIPSASNDIRKPLARCFVRDRDLADGNALWTVNLPAEAYASMRFTHRETLDLV